MKQIKQSIETNKNELNIFGFIYSLFIVPYMIFKHLKN